MLGVVYKITCMGTGRSYVGRTSNYNIRISAHFSNLRKGVHSSSMMQSDFDEYGMSSFVSEVLCSGSMDYMGNMESFMIKFYKPEYNTANVVVSKVDSSHGLLCRFSSEWENRWGSRKLVKPIHAEKFSNGTRKRKLSTQDRVKIVEEYIGGSSSRELSRHYGISYSMVLRYVRKAGVEYRAVSGRKKAPTS